MSLMFTVPTFTSIGDVGANFLAAFWKAGRNFVGSHYHKGDQRSAHWGGGSETRNVLYCSHSLSQVYGLMRFSIRNILYFWAVSQLPILKTCFKDQNTHRCCAQMPPIEQKLVWGWEIDDTHICSAFTRLFTTHWNLLIIETAFLSCASSIAIYKSAICKVAPPTCALLPRPWALHLRHVRDNGQWIKSCIIPSIRHCLYILLSGQNYIRIWEVQVLIENAYDRIGLYDSNKRCNTFILQYR